MPPEDFFDKYPRTKKFLEQHPGTSLDQALILTEIEISKLKAEGRG